MTPWAWEERRALLLSELPPGARWLDLGCGGGVFLSLAPNGTGVDADPAAVERARAHGDARAMDGDAIPLAHGEVGFVWCSEVLGFVADPLALVQEARRVLAPGGRLVVTVPRSWPGRVPDPRNARLRHFTPRTLRALLTDAGFDARVSGQRWLVARGSRA